MDELKGKIILDDTVYETNLTKKFALRQTYKPETGKEVRAFIPGVIRDVAVTTGSHVKKGDMLLILEAMKMKNRIFSPIDGKVLSVFPQVGDKVAKNQLLVEFE
ncbi:MAG: hypothetical protein A2X64_00335 [Ignavibacteria bacterium GWF2_33_9]|nr:MAG: hypothetical protein A2X64_00335 [Ignavibacteria bacterium GWF2_33_9]